MKEQNSGDQKPTDSKANENDKSHNEEQKKEQTNIDSESKQSTIGESAPMISVSKDEQNSEEIRETQGMDESNEKFGENVQAAETLPEPPVENKVGEHVNHHANSNEARVSGDDVYIPNRHNTYENNMYQGSTVSPDNFTAVENNNHNMQYSNQNPNYNGQPIQRQQYHRSENIRYTQPPQQNNRPRGNACNTYDHFDQLHSYPHPRFSSNSQHTRFNLFSHDRMSVDPRHSRNQCHIEPKPTPHPSQMHYQQMMQAQYEMHIRNQYYAQEQSYYQGVPGYPNLRSYQHNIPGPNILSCNTMNMQGIPNEQGTTQYVNATFGPTNQSYQTQQNRNHAFQNKNTNLVNEFMQPGLEHNSRTENTINAPENTIYRHENQTGQATSLQGSEQGGRIGHYNKREAPTRVVEDNKPSLYEILDPKNFPTPDLFTIQQANRPREKEKRKKVRDSSDNEQDSAQEESSDYDTSSALVDEVQPKKRGRPRKSTQPTPFQRPQMPYNPNIQSPLGNQYVPNYAPMNYKPTHPFNPVNPKIHNYQTKQTMRNLTGPSASSYQHIFNHPVYRHFNVPQQNGYPPNMYMPPPQAPVRQSGPQYNPYTTFSYARPPSIGRPKAAPYKREAMSSPIIKRKRKSAASIPILQPEYEEEPSQVTEEEQDPIEKLLNIRDDDHYFVKFRHKSYLHCDWVSKDEICQTKGGVIKVKRYRKKTDSFDPDYIKIDKILHSDYEDVEVEEQPEDQGEPEQMSDQQSPRKKTLLRKKIYLVKWKKLAHELATFEYEDKIKDLEGFETELLRYEKRKTIRQKMYSLEWRPSREHFIRFNTSPVYKNDNNLRAYQLEGLNWLLNRWFYKQGCIMADEMGLGKTVQSVTFVNTLFTKYECGPVLIVAPLSTLPHWEREFEAWTDLRTTTYHGSIQGREIIYNYEMVNDNRYLFDVLITTYEMVMSGLKHLENIRFSVGIFDEAHRLKNNNSKAVLALKNIYFNHKVLLSGTPLQNNVQELWSLLNFIDTARFNSLQFFLEEYKLERSEDVERLQNLLKPLMLRRMKDDVEKSIPVKEETIIEVELTMIQKRFYRALLEKNLEFLTRGGNAPNLINVMIELRKCCIHPYLIRGAEDQIINEYKERKKALQSIEDATYIGNEEITKNPHTGNFEEENDSENQTGEKIIPAAHVGNFFGLDYEEYYKVLLQSSGKLVLLDKLLAKLKGSHKVLVFSQMTKCLDLLAEYLTFRNHKFERIDGAVRGDQRQAAIDRFSSQDNDVFVFLLCTRAGGVGINLTAADTVVIFDSDWNPQNDLQAQARCHRIGQKNEVKVYRLVTRNTYEREMFDKAGMKLGLDRAVLQKMSFEGDKKGKKKDAIETLLKKGAYGVLMETDDIAQKFCEEDIDSILERRTKVVKHMDSGNVFSKATFQVEEEMDDPDFWDNLLNKKKTEEDEGKIKKQVRRLSRGVKINYNKIDQAIKELEKEVEKIEWPEINLEQHKQANTDETTAISHKEANKNQDDNNKINVETNAEIVKNESASIITTPDTNTQEINNTTTELDKRADIAANKTSDSMLTSNSSLDEQQLLNYKKLALLIFLTALRKGTHAVNTIKNSRDTNKILAGTIKYCIEKIDSRQRADFSLHMEIYLKEEYDRRFYEDMPFYEEYYEIFVLRIQIVHILAVLLKRGDISNVEKTKGYTSEDDKRIIKWVLTYGYDNFPSSTGSEKGAFKGKKSDDLNGRVRKLVIALNRPVEQAEEKDDLYKICLSSFGKICDDNRKAVEKWHRDRDGGDYKTFEKEVNAVAREILSGKKKRGISDVSLHERILMFDRLRQLEEVPTLRKTQGIPRRWNNENDIELRDSVLTNGLTELLSDKIGMPIDSIVKRVEAMIEKKEQ